MEDAIRQPDISKSVQRFQLAIDEAKVRLNLAVSPGAWLKPSNLVINTQSAVGYNNGLRKSGVRMKLGVNDSVNADPPEIDRPTLHPSNPIHRPVNNFQQE